MPTRDATASQTAGSVLSPLIVDIRRGCASEDAGDSEDSGRLESFEPWWRGAVSGGRTFTPGG